MSIETTSGLEAQRVQRWVVATAIAGMFVVATSLTLAHASLYGDGSYYLLNVIRTKSPFLMAGREGVNAVRDSPVLVALALDVSNTRVLALMQSIGYIVLPSIVWVAVLALAARDAVRFTLIAILCAVCVGLMAFFSVSELELALPLVAFVSTALTDPRSLSKPLAGAVTVASLVLVAAHESVALCAVVLGINAYLRLRAKGMKGPDRTAGRWVVWTSAATVGWAVWTFTTRHNDNSEVFFGALTSLRPRSAVLLIAAGTGLALWTLLPALRRRPVISALTLAAVIFATLTGVAVAALRSGPAGNYGARGFCVVFTLLVQIALLLIWIGRNRHTGALSRIQTPANALLVAPIIFLLVVLVMPLAHAASWVRGLTEMRQVITTRSGVLAPAESLSPQTQKSVLWGWSNPTLSVLLRDSHDDAVILDKRVAQGLEPLFEPFPAEDAQHQLPDQYTWR